MIRYCFECGHVGPVSATARDCCPDGNHAVMVPTQLAIQAHRGFHASELSDLADKVVISNATGNEVLFLDAVQELLAAIRAKRGL